MSGADLGKHLEGIPALFDRHEIAPYCTDWHGDRTTGALAVVRPGTTGEVARTMRACRELGLAMVPSGGRTGLVDGHLPDAPDRTVVIALERMNRIRALDADNFVAHVDAGCVLQTVKDAAAEQGLHFPLALGAQGSCQIGGNVATNAGGLNVLRHGMMRDLVLGLEVVLPDGTIWDGMSSLRKDNRGPALHHLFCGAEGAFGIVTGASLKLSPLPDRSVTALFALATLEDCVTFFRMARRNCSDLLSAFEFLPSDAFEVARIAMPDLPRAVDESHGAYALIEIASSGYVDPAALMEQLAEDAMAEGLVVDGALAASVAQSRELWLMREALNEGQARMGPHLRTDVSVPLSEVARFVNETTAALAAALPAARALAYGHLGDGNIHFNVHADPPHRAACLPAAKTIIMERVAAFGGSISAEHGIGRQKREALRTGASPEHHRTLLALKHALDPDGLMNPGCLL
ncbi:hypothetical protein OG2516_18635 [Oceanicola granulosus HTCC2516]|uniref:FAD-binding PCMH-type domain-containing protein n=1 Tax=Oceanicola granulosus (strain ATCC BAA-861 / DSM 15982 / KCTC 12143 / HTCC2516) TaxID=314256 RepID=Q2CHC9_OCEGH|nr:FAD-binding oxidoreductase [Oceanicola granulosus]EAR52110.1 hypothetical protein OG2516_18635 [Oceanicola granulosus HTCC2516]